MRRLHEIDEEKRARALEMRHCGISSWGPNEIPFGVRAIQRGIEVEGIWISPSTNPDTSQDISSTTLVVDHTELNKIQNPWVDLSPSKARRSRYASDNSILDQNISADMHDTTQTTLVASIDEPFFLTRKNGSAEKRSKSTSPTDGAQVQTYIPTGALSSRPARGADRQVNTRHTQAKHTVDTSRRNGRVAPPSRIPVPSRRGGGPMLYSRAGRRAYRCTRQANRNFVILPTSNIPNPRQASSRRNNASHSIRGTEQPTLRNNQPLSLGGVISK